MRWIPVDERRPNHSRSVLGRVQAAGSDGFTIQVVSYINLLDAWVQFVSGEPARSGERVTHWMELPYPATRASGDNGSTITELAVPQTASG